MHSQSLCGAAIGLSLSLALSAQDGGRSLFETFGAGWSRGGGYATSLAVIGDVDADGIADIAVGDPTFLYVFGTSGTGTVDILSGHDGSLLATCNPTSTDTSLGLSVAAAGDVDGDGVPDVVASSQQSVMVFSGATGTMVQQIPAVAARVIGPGDWDNDQVPDIGWYDGLGAVQIQTVAGTPIATVGSSPVDGAVAMVPTGGVPVRESVAVLQGGALLLIKPGLQSVSVPGPFGFVGPAGDFDGDGNGDVVTLQTSSGMAEVRSGATGALLAAVPGGSQLASGADIDGDGVFDVAVGEFAANGTGALRVYSGASGLLLFERLGQELGEGMGWRVAMHPGVGMTRRPAALVGSYARYDGSLEAGSISAVALAAPGEIDGWFRPFGSPCNYRNTQIRPGFGRPRIGTTYGFRFDNQTTPQGFQYLVIGDSRTSFNGTPLPFQLPGALTCSQLYVSIDIVEFAGLNSFASITIPNRPVFLGYTAYVQGISLLGAPIIEVSDAAEMLIGN